MRQACLGCLLALLLIISACSNASLDPVEETDGIPSENIASVDGEMLSRTEFEYLLSGLLEGYTMYTGAAVDWDTEIDGRPAELFFREGALEQAVTARVVQKKAREYGITISETEESGIRAYIEQEIAYLGGPEAFENHLQSLGADRETHEFYNYRIPMLTEKLKAILFEEGSPYFPEEAELQSFAERHFLNLSYIYLSALDQAGNAPSSELYASRQASAEALRNEAEAGADFTEMILAYGEDYMMLLTPEGMVVPKGQNGDVFDKAAAALSVGELSPVVATDAGFYIILRRPDNEAWYAENRDTVMYEYQLSSFSALVNQWCAEIPVETTENYLALDIQKLTPKG